LNHHACMVDPNWSFESHIPLETHNRFQSPLPLDKALY
jgi:hypothetical protein